MTVGDDLSTQEIRHELGAVDHADTQALRDLLAQGVDRIADLESEVEGLTRSVNHLREFEIHAMGVLDSHLGQMKSMAKGARPLGGDDRRTGP